MKALVREAMEAGAIGLSTSLIYPPAVFAGAKRRSRNWPRSRAEYGGRYYTHMRNEGERLLEPSTRRCASDGRRARPSTSST